MHIRDAQDVPVSVIIPCFRCSHTIDAAVDSVIDQTSKPGEIILVDDCSNDNGQTLTILKAIQFKHQSVIPIILVSMPTNRGPGEARNAGWSIAKHELIAFLDADDTWHPQKLEIQANWMLKHPDYMLTCHDYEIYSKVMAKKVVFDTINERTLSKRLLLFNNVIATRTVMLRKKIKQRFPLNVRHAEDYDLWLRILRDRGDAKKMCITLAFSYKEEFSLGGVSNDLRAMHKSILNILYGLYKEKTITGMMYILAVSFETLKYWRRIAITSLVN